MNRLCHSRVQSLILVAISSTSDILTISWLLSLASEIAPPGHLHASGLLHPYLFVCLLCLDMTPLDDDALQPSILHTILIYVPIPKVSVPFTSRLSSYPHVSSSLHFTVIWLFARHLGLLFTFSLLTHSTSIYGVLTVCIKYIGIKAHRKSYLLICNYLL